MRGKLKPQKFNRQIKVIPSEIGRSAKHSNNNGTISMYEEIQFDLSTCGTHQCDQMSPLNNETRNKFTAMVREIFLEFKPIKNRSVERLLKAFSSFTDDCDVLRIHFYWMKTNLGLMRT